MFEELKRAWQEAVSNFWRELDAEGADPDARRRRLSREVTTARQQLARLEAEERECARSLAAEEEQVAVCRRRERLARDIGDEETARVASAFGDRHGERARVLAAKLDALSDECRLRRRDLAEMTEALDRAPGFTPAPALDDLDRHPSEGAFRGMEAAERERAAADRLAEIKRRMTENR